MKPSELFDVSGRSALIIGASGAFGAVAARTLAEGRMPPDAGRR